MSEHHYEHLPAGFGRRFAAIVYDGFLLCAIYFLLGGIAVAINGGSALSNEASTALATVVFPVLVFFFLQWFWRKNGQTLGMQVWHIRLHPNGSQLPLTQCAIRYIAGLASLICAGIGFFWMLVDGRKRTLYDILSGTCVVHVPKS